MTFSFDTGSSGGTEEPEFKVGTEILMNELMLINMPLLFRYCVQLRKVSSCGHSEICNLI